MQILAYHQRGDLLDSRSKWFERGQEYQKFILCDRPGEGRKRAIVGDGCFVNLSGNHLSTKSRK